MRAENTIGLARATTPPRCKAARRAGRPGRRAGRLPQRRALIPGGCFPLMGRSSSSVGGGREHALAWKLAQSPKGADRSYVAPAAAARRSTTALVNRAITDVRRCATWAQAEKIALTGGRPRAPLAAGVVDEFRAAACIFGPTRAAAQLESSKAFPRPSCSATASRRRLRHLHRRRGRAFVAWARPSSSRPMAWRRQGRGGGHDAGRSACGRRLDAGGQQVGVQHNEGGARVVIEEFLEGEGQLHHLCDGKNVRRAGHQPGPQAPARTATRPQHRRHGRVLARAGGHARRARRAMREIILPTIRGMESQDGIPSPASVRRPDDRRAGPPQDARIQLPHGRPRNAAHHDAPQERSVRRAGRRHRWHARPGRTAMGPPPRWAW